MAPTNPKSDKKRQYEKEKKERKRKEKAAAESSRTNHPPKEERRDWAAMKASLVFDERGVGSTPDGLWMYFPKAGPASEKALPEGSASERTCWMYMGFEEEGENAREMLPETDDEEEGEEEKKGEGDVEMGGTGGGELAGGVAGLALE